MPEQDEHDKPENLVESPHKTTHSARSLQDAVSSNQSLEGLYAMNDVKDSEELEQEAAEDAQKNEKNG